MQPVTLELISYDNNPMVYVFNVIQITYLAMSLSYLINSNMTSQGDPHGLVGNDAKCVNEYIQSGPSYGGKSDFVLIK